MNQPPLPELFSQLSHDLRTLARSELALTRAEMADGMRAMQQGVAALVVGGLVLLGSLIILLHSAVYGLATTWPLWLAALAVGGGAAVVGIVLLWTGSRRASPGHLRPRRTLASLRRVRETTQRTMQ